MLADDPGSAVLTLTSRGLMALQAVGRKRHASPFPIDGRSIVALWRDDAGRAEELECPPYSQAVWLKVRGHRVPNYTLDGRSDCTSVSWRYAHHEPISVNAEKFSDLLGPYDALLRR